MSNINKISIISKPSGLYVKTFSTFLRTHNPSLTTNQLNHQRTTFNDLNSIYNLNSNKRSIRKISDAVKKEDTAPAFTNQGKSTLYAPYVFEEVSAPSGGGPIYWKTRKFLMNFKRRLLLRARERRWNWDFGRAAFAGVPKLSYDPKINQWVTLMDNEEWGGVGGRFWIDYSNSILLNFLLAFAIYFSWYRIVANNKHNVFARWKNREDEEEE